MSTVWRGRSVCLNKKKGKSKAVLLESVVTLGGVHFNVKKKRQFERIELVNQCLASSEL